MIEAVISDWAGLGTILSAVVSVLTLGGAAYYARVFIKHAGTKAQLDAKNEIIETNEQSIEALEKRLTTLEGEFVKATDRMTELDRELQLAKQENATLRQYTAPELTDHLVGMIQTRISEVDRALARIELEIKR